ncbi:hypothetical protein EJB05_21031, partial [Eragrostis curvula]
MKAAARALHELPGDTKRRNADVTQGSGYMAPTATNPLFESLGAYDAANPADVDAFCALLDAPPSIRWRPKPTPRIAILIPQSRSTETIAAYTGKMHELVLDVAAKLAASLGVAEEDGGVPSFRDWPCQFRAPEALVDERRPRKFRAFSYDEYRRIRRSSLAAWEVLAKPLLRFKCEAHRRIYYVVVRGHGGIC